MVEPSIVAFLERLGKLIEKYGTGESNGIAFSDHDEVWYFETGAGIKKLLPIPSSWSVIVTICFCFSTKNISKAPLTVSTWISMGSFASGDDKKQKMFRSIALDRNQSSCILQISQYLDLSDSFLQNHE